MTLPNLKRVKVSTPQELRTWLTKTGEDCSEVLIVTCGRKSKDKHIPGADVRRTIAEHGWIAGRSYSMIGNLQGHVARRP